MRAIARFVGTIFSIAALSSAGSALAADSACAKLVRAIDQGLKQTRIHVATANGMPSSDGRPVWAHSIVSGDDVYLEADTLLFDRVSGVNSQMRSAVAVLPQFRIEDGCNSLGIELLAGREFEVVESVRIHREGVSTLTVWIDTKSGLPARIDAVLPGMRLAASSAGEEEHVHLRYEPSGKLVTKRHAFLFGDDVKVPNSKGTISREPITQIASLIK